MLYLINLLHQTATNCFAFAFRDCCILSISYIKPRRCRQFMSTIECCILSIYYIKPRPIALHLHFATVVSYQSPTSNRDDAVNSCQPLKVVSYQSTTSNRDQLLCICISRLLYLINLLHQTATMPSIHVNH